MASPSAKAAFYMSQHALRPTSWLAEDKDGRVLTNPCDWLHDTAVTNRAEKRRALAQAKKYGCQEEKKADGKRGTATTWVHAKACPGWKAPEKKAVSAEDHLLENIGRAVLNDGAVDVANEQAVGLATAAFTPAGRLHAALELLHAPVVDDAGNVIGEQALITQEEARRILEVP